MNILESTLEIIMACVPNMNNGLNFKKGAHQIINLIYLEYNKCCPRPQLFPDGCKFATIDPDGEIIFHINKPTIVSGWYSEPYPEYKSPHNVDMPLGIDWRLCCWSIEDAKRIWGKE